MSRSRILVAALSWAPAGTAPAQAPPCEGCPGNAPGVFAWVKGEVLATFVAGTGEDLVRQVAREEGARVDRRLGDEPPRWLLQVPVGAELESADRIDARAEVEQAGPNDVGCVPEAPPADCCPSDALCDGLSPCEFAEVGDLRVSKLAGRREIGLVLARSSSCEAPDHAIVQGVIGDFDAKWSVDCSDDQGPALTERLSPPPGDLFYLVTAHGRPTEGSMGLDSLGFKRVPAMGDCALGDQSLPCCR